VPLSGTRLALRDVEPLVVDDNPQSTELLGAILMGFGISRPTKCHSVEAAREVLLTRRFDLVMVNCEMVEEDGFTLVREMRAGREGPNACTPVLMLSASTPESKVVRARDSGANFTIAKPVSPMILLERMLWIAQSRRAFIDTPRYQGPDRRFRTEPLPPGVHERRAEDLRITATPDRALSQDEIDGLFT
jgi:DNA-binding response OmpR family regulator